MYGGRCCTRPTIHVWCKKFDHGHESVDEKKPGRCVASATEATTSAVDSLTWSDRRVMG